MGLHIPISLGCHFILESGINVGVTLSIFEKKNEKWPQCLDWCKNDLKILMSKFLVGATFIQGAGYMYSRLYSTSNKTFHRPEAFLILLWSQPDKLKWPCFYIKKFHLLPKSLFRKYDAKAKEVYIHGRNILFWLFPLRGTLLTLIMLHKLNYSIFVKL